jgi:catechol 2,3-dioxygenase-like lactoylglutathione lyase family enzyme
MADTAKVASVMLDCNDLEGEVAFWREILGLEEKMRFSRYVFLSRLGEKGPRLAFQQVPEAKTIKNRMHLDLAAADPEALMARVLELGGRHIRDFDLDGFGWTVMADPEGNEFCVIKDE